MGVDSEPTPTDQQPELLKVEILQEPSIDLNGQTSHDLRAEEQSKREGDNAKIREIRTSLGLETTEENGILLVSTSEECTDYDEALGKFVLGDNPDRIVDQILNQIPNSLTMADNYLGEIKKSIRIWITESAANAARHISYRKMRNDPIQYHIEIFCKTKMMHGGKYLEISMQDNGIGIKPENLDKIGQERFTTSNEHKNQAGVLHRGGNGRFSVDFKNEIAYPREWEMAIKNRDNGEQGAVSFLTIPLRNIEDYEEDRLAV